MRNHTPQSISLSVDVSGPVAAVNGLRKQHTPKLIQAKMHGESEVSLSALACAVAGGCPQALVRDTARGPGPVHTASRTASYRNSSAVPTLVQARGSRASSSSSRNNGLVIENKC